MDDTIIGRLAGSKVLRRDQLPGGDISGASKIELADGRLIVAKNGPVVQAEGRMLEIMARSGAPVPRVIGSEGNILLIECLPADGLLAGDAWVSLAQALNALHAYTETSFGWSENYAFRHVSVENDRLSNWPEFWAEKRLLCHLPHIPKALGTRIEGLCSRLADLLPADPTPSLLHGDLWGGNILVSGDRISGLIDPCAYYGNREVDVASLTVFDSPDESFFDALDLAPQWQDRMPIYRLWMWLVHLRLFGASYRSAVERELGALGF